MANYNKSFLLGVTLVATLGGFLFGFDTGVISGAEKLLQTHFGTSAAVHGFVVSSALIGCMVGSFVSGILAKGIGRKKSLLIASVLLLISAAGSAYPENFFGIGGLESSEVITYFVIFRLIGGIGVGLASAIAPVYIAEIAPSSVRGKLVSVNQLAIVLGFVVVFFVNYFIKDASSTTEATNYNLELAWRYMFASECLPAVLFFLLLLFVPFSPRWLVMKDRDEEALKVLTTVNGEERANKELEEIKESLDEKDESSSSIFAFPKIGLILFIGIALSFFQQITGINAILYYGPRIFESMKLEGDIALVNQIIVGISMMIFTIVAIFTVEKFGRKPLLSLGTLGMGVCILIFSACMYYEIYGYFALAVLVGYIAFFSISQGPIVWVYLSELFPNKVRGVAISLAVFAQWLANYLVSQTFPILADENGSLYNDYNGAAPFWIFGFFCFVAVLFIWKLVPETKGKTLEEIEKHWTTK